MLGKWQAVLLAINRALIRHDINYYRRRELEAYHLLKEEQRKGLIVEADRIGDEGKLLQDILDDLLTHPLCRKIEKKPELCVSYHIGSEFSTFSNTIIVPDLELECVSEKDKPKVASLRAAIAHELGHIISGDNDPESEVQDPHRYANQRMERRADLIAAHLCGDGGKSLAEFIAKKIRIETAVKRSPSFNESWVDKAINRTVTCIDRRYPRPEERVRYLRQWASDQEKGKLLPRIASLSNDISLRG